MVLPNGRSMNTGDSGAEDSGRLWLLQFTGGEIGGV